jgi:hypothetical protein
VETYFWPSKTSKDGLHQSVKLQSSSCDIICKQPFSHWWAGAEGST